MHAQKDNFGSTPRFPFQLVGMDLQFHVHKISILLSSWTIIASSRKFLIYQWDCKFGTNGNKPFQLVRKSFRNFKAKILVKWKAPLKRNGRRYNIKKKIDCLRNFYVWLCMIIKCICIVRNPTLLAVLPLVTRLTTTDVIAIVVNAGGAILTRFACFTWVLMVNR